MTEHHASSTASAGAAPSLLWLPAVVVVGSVCLGVRVLLGDYGGNAAGLAQLAWWVSVVTLVAVLATAYVKVTGDRWLLAAVGVGLVAVGVYGLPSGWPYLPGGLLFTVAGALPAVWRQGTSASLLVATAVVATVAIALLPLIL